MQRVYELLSTGFGLPAISFHEPGTNGLRYYGQFSEVDLLDHSHIGCVELGIPGCSYTDPMNAFINIPKILLITMNNGSCGSRRVGLDINPGRSWDHFIKAFYAQLEYFVGLYTSAMNDAGPFYSRYYYRPLVSALVKGCVEKAVPVDSGGAVYWNRAVNCTGFATTVDSLHAVKKLIYEEKRVTLEELRQILESDFEGAEDLRQYIRNRLAKFGNGDEEVDRLACELSAEYSKMVRARHTHVGTPYRPGIYSFYEPIKSMGKRTGATPDGRKKGEVLSLNCAPAHGAVKKGLSSVLRSATAIRHSLVDNASCLDVRLSGKTPPAVIKTIVDYLGRRDVLYVQFTVVDNHELMEAYERPADYQDLVVRVTGYSARFVVLPKDTQKEIIGRSSWN
jgi:formate C-acetyltransferase